MTNKPVCECGGDLILYTSETIESWYKIDNEGHIMEKPFESKNKDKTKTLMCINENCDNVYKAKWEDKALVRGDKIL